MHLEVFYFIFFNEPKPHFFLTFWTSLILLNLIKKQLGQMAKGYKLI